MCTLTHGASPRFDVCVWKSLAHRLPHCVVGGQGSRARRDRSDRYWSSLLQSSKGPLKPLCFGMSPVCIQGESGREGQLQSMPDPSLSAAGSVWIYMLFFLFLTDTVVIRYMSVSHLSNNKKMSKLNKFSLFIQYKKTVLPLLQLIFCFYSAFKQNKDLRERLYNAKFPCCYMLNFVG